MTLALTPWWVVFHPSSYWEQLTLYSHLGLSSENMDKAQNQSSQSKTKWNKTREWMRVPWGIPGGGGGGSDGGDAGDAVEHTRIDQREINGTSDFQKIVWLFSKFREQINQESSLTGKNQEPEQAFWMPLMAKRQHLANHLIQVY